MVKWMGSVLVCILQSCVAAPAIVRAHFFEVQWSAAIFSMKRIQERTDAHNAAKN
jgi:hypothetical protein